MTMYLPNPNLHPTGAEPAEFIDAHHAAEPGDRPVARVDPREGSTGSERRHAHRRMAADDNG